MTDDMAAWARLGELLVARRVHLGWNRRAAFARDKGLPNDRLLFDLENAKRTNYDAATYAVVEQAYGWTTGSVKRVLAGGEPTVVDETPSERPALSVVPATVEAPSLAAVEEDNEVLAAIRRDPDLDDSARAHFLNQYVLLRDLSRLKKGDTELLPYVAHGKRTTPVDPAEEAAIEERTRAAVRENPDSPHRDK